VQNRKFLFKKDQNPLKTQENCFSHKKPSNEQLISRFYDASPNISIFKFLFKMKQLFERIFIKLLKKMKVDLLAHAHVQIGVGHNTYNSGEDYVINDVIATALGSEPKTVFDVGANIGEYAKMISNRFPNALVYCFEPIPATFQILSESTTGLNTINTQAALGSSAGSIDIHMGGGNSDGSMASVYKTPLETIFSFVGEVNQTISVPITTLDEFCKDISANIDFLKIDVEGHELEVLKGAANLIKEDKISLIQFEFNEFNMFSKTFMFDFYRTLPQFDFYRIMPGSRLLPMGEYNSSLEIFRYQNILAINKKLNYKPL
jgi:FkbM family methyltransferase